MAIDSEAVLRVEARELDAGATLAAILLPIIVVVGVTASLGSSLSW